MLCKQSANFLFVLMSVLLISSTMYCQIGVTLNEDPIFDDYPKYWEDPNDVTYSADTIWEPDINGVWTFYEIRDGETRVDIFTHEVFCYEEIEVRSSQHKEYSLNIFPNPASQVITIAHSFPNGEMSIFDLSGRLLISNKINVSGNKTIDISKYPPGAYFLSVVGQYGKYSKLFVIQ